MEFPVFGITDPYLYHHGVADMDTVFVKPWCATPVFFALL